MKTQKSIFRANRRTIHPVDRRSLEGTRSARLAERLIRRKDRIELQRSEGAWYDQRGRPVVLRMQEQTKKILFAAFALIFLLLLPLLPFFGILPGLAPIAKYESKQKVGNQGIISRGNPAFDPLYYQAKRALLNKPRTIPVTHTDPESRRAIRPHSLKQSYRAQEHPQQLRPEDRTIPAPAVPSVPSLAPSSAGKLPAPNASPVSPPGAASPIVPIPVPAPSSILPTSVPASPAPSSISPTPVSAPTSIPKLSSTPAAPTGSSGSTARTDMNPLVRSGDPSPKTDSPKLPPIRHLHQIPRVWAVGLNGIVHHSIGNFDRELILRPQAPYDRMKHWRCSLEIRRNEQTTKRPLDLKTTVRLRGPGPYKLRVNWYDPKTKERDVTRWLSGCLVRRHVAHVAGRLNGDGTETILARFPTKQPGEAVIDGSIYHPFNVQRIHGGSIQTFEQIPGNGQVHGFLRSTDHNFVQKFIGWFDSKELTQTPIIRYHDGQLRIHLPGGLTNHSLLVWPILQKTFGFVPPKIFDEAREERFAYHIIPYPGMISTDGICPLMSGPPVIFPLADRWFPTAVDSKGAAAKIGTMSYQLTDHPLQLQPGKTYLIPVSDPVRSSVLMPALLQALDHRKGAEIGSESFHQAVDPQIRAVSGTIIATLLPGSMNDTEPVLSYLYGAPHSLFHQRIASRWDSTSSSLDPTHRLLIDDQSYDGRQILLDSRWWNIPHVETVRIRTNGILPSEWKDRIPYNKLYESSTPKSVNCRIQLVFLDRNGWILELQDRYGTIDQTRITAFGSITPPKNAAVVRIVIRLADGPSILGIQNQSIGNFKAISVTHRAEPFNFDQLIGDYLTQTVLPDRNHEGDITHEPYARSDHPQDLSVLYEHELKGLAQDQLRSPWNDRSPYQRSSTTASNTDSGITPTSDVQQIRTQLDRLENLGAFGSALLIFVAPMAVGIPI